jgi:hypothetical protein
MTTSTLEDLMVIIDYLARQKTLPPKEQAAMDRLHAEVAAKRPASVKKVTDDDDAT